MFGLCMYACIDLKFNTLTMSTTGHGQVYAYSNNVTIVHYYIACYVYDSCHHITIYGGFAFNSKRSKLVYVNVVFSGVSTVGPSGAHAPLTFSLLNVIIK